MYSITGKRLYLRKAELKVLRKVELKVLEKWAEEEAGKVSVRDIITRNGKDKFYYLWDTELVKKVDGKAYIYITGEHGKDSVYYGNYPRRKEVIMTNTTKSRLNSFLEYYGYNPLEVHSSKKEWSIKHNGKELELNTWYRLAENWELVKAK